MTAPTTELERLRALEWRGNAQGTRCPICDEEPPINPAVPFGIEWHDTETCWLAARIAELDPQSCCGDQADPGGDFERAATEAQKPVPPPNQLIREDGPL